jgi:hypothetical protein
MHPERPGRLLAERLLTADPEDKPSHFADVDRETTFTNIDFQIENGTLS